MQLTGEDVRLAFERAATEGRTGQPVSFERIAELLNQHMADNRTSRSPDNAGGKHRRPAERETAE
jgi:hypothetical protein